MTLIKRIESPVPAFFKKVRKWGMLMAGLGGAIVAAPVALPTILVTVGGYLVVAGAATIAVSSVATEADVTSED